jgi:hypothetical protein
MTVHDAFKMLAADERSWWRRGQLPIGKSCTSAQGVCRVDPRPRPAAALGAVVLLTHRSQMNANAPCADLPIHRSTHQLCQHKKNTSSCNAPQGILRHGFGRWKPIVDDAQLDLKTQLRLELASKRALEAPAGSAAAAAAGALPPADGPAAPSEQPAAATDEVDLSAADPGDADSVQVHLSTHSVGSHSITLVYAGCHSSVHNHLCRQ